MTDNIIDTWTRQAQSILQNGRWYPLKFESAANGYIMITGAECPLKKNGTPNYRKRDKMTQCVVVVPVGDEKGRMENVRVKGPLQRSSQGRPAR